MTLLVIVCVILLTVILCLVCKLYSVKNAIGEIIGEFNERIENDTNTLITTDCTDADIRNLAVEMNKSLIELRREKYRLKQSDNELKDAITNISHDLRTPLTAISGYLELLEKKDKSVEVARYLEIIEGRINLLISLTDELFKYSVIVSTFENCPEEICLNAIIEESLASFYTELSEKGIVPEVLMPDIRVMRKLDPSAVTRILSNIISNAVRHGSEYLKVALTDGGIIRFSNPAPDITEVEVGRLFDRFYTVSTARKSTGLGLAISKSLAERLGGKITARKENDELIITVEL